ncbi:hypothetical protein D3C87_2065460 [compost metagenome]
MDANVEPGAGLLPKVLQHTDSGCARHFFWNEIRRAGRGRFGEFFGDSLERGVPFRPQGLVSANFKCRVDRLRNRAVIGP